MIEQIRSGRKSGWRRSAAFPLTLDQGKPIQNALLRARKPLPENCYEYSDASKANGCYRRVREPQPFCQNRGAGNEL